MKQLSWAVALAAAFLVGKARAADPPPKKPALGGLPSVLEPVTKPTVPTPLAVLPIDDQKVRIFWVTDYAGTIPVRWKVCQATGTAGLTIIPIGAAEVIVPLQGGTDISKQTIPPGSKYPIAVAGTGKGELTLVADGVQGDEIVTLLSYRVSVNQAAQPPPVVVPPPGTGSKYLLIVRQNGPATQAFEQLMRDPAWEDHRKAGIQVRDATLEESLAVYKSPNGTPVPFVVSLLIAEDGKSAKVVAAPVALPTDSPSIKKLSEAFK